MTLMVRQAKRQAHGPERRSYCVSGRQWTPNNPVACDCVCHFAKEPCDLYTSERCDGRPYKAS